MESSTLVKAVPVVLPVNHWAALKQEAIRDGTSASAIVRGLVAAHLQRAARKSTRDDMTEAPQPAA